MGEGLKFEIAQDNAQNEVQEQQKMRERLRSLQGMILKGGKQGENAKKVLLREFGQLALGLIVELEREAKKRKK